MAESTTIGFQFGSLQLCNVQTIQYRADQVSDASGTDVIGVKHVIRVSGTLAAGLVPATTGERGPDVLARLQYAIRNRRYLLYQIGGKKIVEVGDSTAPTDPAKNIDSQNGPKLLSISTPSITESTIIVELGVEAVTIPCTAADRSILTHRFEESHEYDTCGYCSITTSGTIHLRSDRPLALSTVLKSAGIPQRRNGFQRSTSRAVTTPDNLKITYTLIDKEYFLGPPEEAGECKIRTEVALSNSSTGYVTCRTYLRGHKPLGPAYDVFFALLFRRAIIIADLQIRPFRLETDGLIQVSDVTYAKDYDDGSVTVTCRARCDTRKMQQSGKSRWDVMGQSGITPATALTPLGGAPTGYDFTKAGVELVEAFRAAVQDPCGDLAIVNTKPGREDVLVSGGVPPWSPEYNLFGGGSLASAGSGGTGGTGGSGTGNGTGGGTPGTGGNQNPPAGGGGLPPNPYEFPDEIDPNGPIVLSIASRGTGGGQSPPPAPSTNVLPTPSTATTFANQIGDIIRTLRNNPLAPLPTLDLRVPYEICVIECETDVDEGVMVIPSAGRGSLLTGELTTGGTTPSAIVATTKQTAVYPKAVKVRRHAPHATLRVNWVMHRGGTRPLAPDPTPPDGLVLLHRKVIEQSVDSLASGQYVFRLSGVYEYAYLDASQAHELNPLGNMIAAEYYLSKHRREATPITPFALWHTFQTIQGLPDNPDSAILGPQPTTVPATSSPLS